MTTEKPTTKRAAKKVTAPETESPKKAASTSMASAQVDPLPSANKSTPVAASAPTETSAKPKKKGLATAPAEPPAKKKVTKKTVAEEPKKAKTNKALPKPKASTKKPSDVTKKELKHLIAVAAYHRAEKRGFAPGYELQDWLDAEAAINAMIGASQS